MNLKLTLTVGRTGLRRNGLNCMLIEAIDGGPITPLGLVMMMRTHMSPMRSSGNNLTLVGDVQILPPEILGWIVLRRSGLPASSRLSVLSAINNKLDLDTIERAIRDRKEELLMSEAHRRDLPRPRRSFWVKESGE